MVVANLVAPRTLVARHVFQMVGTRWSGSAGLQVRAGLGAGSWSAWVDVSAEAPVWTGDARHLQLRRVGGGTVTDLRLSFFTIPPDVGTAAPVRGAVLPAAAMRPAIVTRAGWGADDSMRRANPIIAPALKMIFVHHTATTNGYSCGDSARIVRGIYAYHVRTLGWNDIGYNFLIDRCGTVFEGRWGGITRPVVGAQSKGFNYESAGIALIGDFTAVRPTTAALVSLERLIAWRLDVAHVDPTTLALMTSSGNDRYPVGRRAWLRVVSGHRDGSSTSCPGAALYALLPGIARAARSIGLPKIWNPRVTGALHRLAPDAVSPLRFQVVFSHSTSWRVSVIGPTGIVASHSGSGTTAVWTWNGTGGLLPAGAYRWTLSAPGARSVWGFLGTLPPWLLAGPPVTFTGTAQSGNLASLQRVDGDVLQVDGQPSTLETDNSVPMTAAEWQSATAAGVSFTMRTGGHAAGFELWDFASSSWVSVGSCQVTSGSRCMLTIPIAGHTFGVWHSGSQTVDMRARYTYPLGMLIDSARTVVEG
ncbi:MAG: peptidoglycan recognition protein family protein [Gaiellales bacterium]